MTRYLVLTLLALCVIGCSDQKQAQKYLQKGQYQKVIDKFKESPNCSTEVAQASRHVVTDLFQEKKFCDVVQLFKDTPFQIQACETLYAMGWFDNLKSCCQGTEALIRRLAEEQAQVDQATADSIARRRHYYAARPEFIQQADELAHDLAVWKERLWQADITLVMRQNDRWLHPVNAIADRTVKLQRELAALEAPNQRSYSGILTRDAMENLAEAAEWLQIAIATLGSDPRSALGSAVNPDPLGSTAYRLREVESNLSNYEALLMEANQVLLKEQDPSTNPVP